MSLKRVLFISLCGAALSGATVCAAQTAPPAGSITQSNTRFVQATVAAVITDASGTVSVSPMAIGNALDPGPSPSDLTDTVYYSQDNGGAVSSRIYAPAGATALVIDGTTDTVTIAASSFGNKAARSDLQTQVSLTQTLSGTATITTVNNIEVDDASGAISDTPSAFGNYYDGSLAYGTLALSQSTAATGRVSTTDNSSYNVDSGPLTIRPSAYGNFATVAVNTVALGTGANPSVTQTNNVGVSASYNGSISGASGTVVIAPLAVGNYATTVPRIPPGTK